MPRPQASEITQAIYNTILRKSGFRHIAADQDPNHLRTIYKQVRGDRVQIGERQNTGADGFNEKHQFELNKNIGGKAAIPLGIMKINPDDLHADVSMQFAESKVPDTRGYQFYTHPIVIGVYSGGQFERDPVLFGIQTTQLQTIDNFGESEFDQLEHAVQTFDQDRFARVLAEAGNYKGQLTTLAKLTEFKPFEPYTPKLDAVAAQFVGMGRKKG